MPWLVGVLQRLVAVAPAVCLLRAGSASTTGQVGTGFRIAPDLLLTNWHVLHFNGVPAATVGAEWGYEDDGRGGGRASTLVACDPQSIRGDLADDWAVVRVTEPLGDAIPMVRLSAAALPVVGAPAFIVQHPGEQRKRLAYVRNQITEVNPRVVQYLSDTQQGSSGAPVLDEQARLVALHHAGGRPQELVGKPPVRKNEGIRIERVRSGLAELRIEVP